jgi:hypothetical protein
MNLFCFYGNVLGYGFFGKYRKCLQITIDINRAMVGNIECILLENYTVFLDIKSLVTEEEDVVDRGEL